MAGRWGLLWLHCEKAYRKNNPQMASVDTSLMISWSQPLVSHPTEDNIMFIL